MTEAIKTIEECAEWLSAHDNFLIITHRRPDGDTLGSAAALAHCLQKIGKCAFLLGNPETTPRYLPFVEAYLAPPDFTADTIITVDTASRDMLPDIAASYDITLAIDHHPTHNAYAQLKYLDGGSASCGEIVFDIIKRLGAVDKTAAAALYVAVATDTGCFSFENTSPDALCAAAELIKLGAPAVQLNRLLFRSKTRGRIAIEGMVYSGMEFMFGDRAVVVLLTREMIKRAGAVEDDLENIAAFPLSVAGVEVGATLRELEDGGCKVSMRSSQSVNSSEICARFGGGGHFSAAGFTAAEPPEVVRDRLIPVFGEFLGA